MKRMILWAIVACGGLAVAIPARAGNGTVVDGKVNMTVRFTYREADVTSWRPLFDEASRLLYNATDGQLQLGRIRVTNSGQGKDAADIWILDGNSGAFANVLGLGGQGHIYLSQTHKSTSGLAQGQFGLVHEFGHYGLGLYDEYKGISTPLMLAGAGEQVMRSQPHQFCTTQGDSAACIMDGGTTIFPNHERTEFCTAVHGDLSTRHNEGVESDGAIYRNAQEALNGESCWETVARTAGLTSPLAVDTADPPGLQPIEWQVAPEYDRLVIVIDRSASMGLRPNSIAVAKETADLLVGLLHGRKTLVVDGAEVALPGENLAIVTFAGDQAVELPFREILSDASKDSARAVIDAIVADVTTDHLVTDLGGGLQAALDLITGEGVVPASTETVILLSDGGQNAGSNPEDLVPALLARGARVYAVGIGGEANTKPLKEVADHTGGRFFRATATEDVAGIAQAIAEDVRSAGILQAFADSTTGQDESHAILIDSFAEEVTFALQWTDGTLDLTLTSPTGDVIDAGSAGQRPDVEADVSGSFLYLRVSYPEAGLWTALVHPVMIPETVAYGLRVSDENRNVSLQVTTDARSSTYPPTVLLRAELVADVPVAGAQVEATVQRPSGGPVTMQLFDDGSSANGDLWANDGVYQAVFSGYTTDGTYAFRVRAVNVSGTGPDPDLPFVEDGPGPPLSIPAFVRETDVSVEVVAVTGIIPGDLKTNPRTLNAQNPHGPVTCYIELPSPYLAADIDAASLRLNGVAPDLSHPTSLGDDDQDGIADLMVKFRRADVIDATPNLVQATVTVAGALQDGRRFEASDQISVISPGPRSVVTVAPDTLVIGGLATIGWEAGPAEAVTYSGFISLDDGLTWQPLFSGVAGSTQHTWQVAATPSSGARFLVQVDSPEGTVRQTVSAPVAIAGILTGAEGERPATAFLGINPNPLTGRGVLRYSLAAPTEVILDVYDVAGRLVQNLVSSREAAGFHAVAWDGTDVQGRRVSSGVYLYTFHAGAHRATGRVMVVR